MRPADLIGSVYSMRWMTFRNDSGETIPAFGVIQIDGMFTTGRGREVLKASKPKDDPLKTIMFNGTVDVLDGMFGDCTIDLPCAAKYDPAATPAAGEMWHVKDGEFSLFKEGGTVPYSIIGDPDTTNEIVVVGDARRVILKGKTAAAHNKDALGTIELWSGTKGAETDTGQTITDVWNTFGDLDDEDWVLFSYIDSGWEIIAADPC